MKKPKINVTEMEKTVKINPSFPALKVSVKFIPNPRPTTAIFSNQPTVLLLRVKNGCPRKYENKNPPTNAIGLLTNPKIHNTMTRIKSTFINVGFFSRNWFIADFINGMRISVVLPDKFYHK